MKKESAAPGIAEALKKGRLSGRWKYDDLMKILTRMESMDVSVEKKRKVTMVIFIILYIAAAFCLFAALLIPALVGAVLGTLFVILFIRYKRRDMDNEFRFYLKDLLENLKDDIKPEADITLDICLHPTESKEFLKKKSPKYSKGAYHTCYDFNYERDCLTLGLKLTDGNSLRLARRDLLLRSERTKRSSSGKSKTKTKYSSRFIYQVQMRINPERYSFQAPPHPKTGKPITVEQTPKGPVVKMSFVQKLKSGSAKADPLYTLEEIVKLYSLFKPAGQKS